MYLFQQIEEVVLQYNDTRRAIGEFVLKEKSNLRQLSMNEVAKRTYTSKATLVRFAQTIGYSGWREFISAFMEEVLYEERSHAEIDPNFPFNEQDSYEMIANNIGVLQAESIKDTINLLDVNMLNQAVGIMTKSKAITLFCISPYIYLAEVFRRKMLTIGEIVEIANPLEASISTQVLTENDCAIVISYSGNNEILEPIVHISALKKRGVQIIGITSGGDNYIRKNVDCALTMSSRERLYSKISNFATEESVHFLLNVLFSCYFKQNYKVNIEHKIFNSKEIERQRFSTLNNINENP
ncbi:MurR/RpiR family transcriptional regulator [Paenibacillus donghaensis]|uniref:MurR/RpiR family transcriptional regulator n=1 Tax=Paenibacillus donghaensis TaxID=414771 RepID=A0A2Z2K8X0_9BACL|nr:MurR/RpiR family transcriptional regulator [Paenibacillus donghaensis]ASA19775.1 MurR/RpiR family transcriptional regulator [Paenibacillus donghaensis]